MSSEYLLLLAIISMTIFVTVRSKKLTFEAALVGGLLGIFIFMGAGFTGISMIAAFFILGTAATSWKGSYKTVAGIAEANKGRRTAQQVLANTALAGVLGLLVYFRPDQSAILRVLMAGCFSAAMADTLSSELGNIYGSRYYNITSFKKEERGLNGVVSVEGTLFGIAGSCLVAAIYCLGFGWSLEFFWIVIAGTVGNLADSLLGATLERRGVLNNNMVNFLNTLVGAVVGMGLACLL